MVIKFTKNKVNIHIYILAYIMYIIGFLLASTAGELFNNVFYYIENTVIILLIFVLMITFLFDKTTLGKWLLLIWTMVILGGSMYYQVEDKGLLLIYLFILAYPRNLSSKKLAKIAMITMMIMIFLIIFLCHIGLLQNRSFVQHNVLRYAQGFTSPNAFANVVTITIINWIYSSIDGISKDKLLKSSIVMLSILVIVYNIANARAALIFGLLAIISMIVIYYYGKALITKRVVYIIPVISFLTSLSITICSVLYVYKNNMDSTLYRKLEVIFSGRLRYMLQAYDLYGAKLFGNNVDFISYNVSQLSGGKIKWFGIDNSYMYILLCYGIVAVIGMILLYIITSYYTYKNRNMYAVVYLSIISLWGISENMMAGITMNLTLLVFAEYIANFKPRKTDIV